MYFHDFKNGTVSVVSFWFKTYYYPIESSVMTVTSPMRYRHATPVRASRRHAQVYVPTTRDNITCRTEPTNLFSVKV